jgi:hypothetical protein|mmetsp:Transcript_34098/g.45028  ORF Transcript_34098/g.45028 Transcript_34098/m.45028 type:complete len:106 (+) Transcript_34098:627-944(+)
MIGALVTHTAGAVPTRLSQTPAARSLPTAGVYKLDCLRGEQTSMVTKQALTIMNTRGGQEGYMVATTNDATRDDLFCMVISWQAVYEDQLEEDLRPQGCANCTIF